jgi:hypothetical protein
MYIDIDDSWSVMSHCYTCINKATLELVQDIACIYFNGDDF